MRKFFLFFISLFFLSIFTFSQIPQVTRWMGPKPKKIKSVRKYKKGLQLNEIYKSSNFESHKRRIVIIFENGLYGELKSDYVNDYLTELEKSSYSIDVFEYQSGTPEELRDFFKNLYFSQNSLDGVIFVGDLPYVIYELHDNWGGGSGDYDDFPCDLFFMDMTGTWEDVGDCDGCEANNGKYDKITDNSDLAEIWVSRIFPGHVKNHEEYITVINNYLERVANFREKETLTYDNALVYDDDDWKNMANDDKNHLSNIFQESKIDVAEEDSAGNVCTANNYKTNVLPENYQLVYLRSHGYPGGHGFYENNKQSFNYVYITNYLSKVGDVAFYFLFVCSGCDFSSTDNNFGFLGGRAIFNDHGGILSVGSTKTGGIWDDSYFFNKLASKSNFGDSFIYWINNALNDYPDIGPQWWYGMVLIGDGSVFFHPHRIGDLNFDGNVDAVDIELFDQYLISNIGDDKIDTSSADIDMDGKVNILDLVKLMINLSQ